MNSEKSNRRIFWIKFLSKSSRCLVGGCTGDLAKLGETKLLSITELTPELIQELKWRGENYQSKIYGNNILIFCRMLEC